MATKEKLTDDELGTMVDAEFTSAMGADGGDIAKEREKALDYYHSKPVGVLTPVEGQSKVVSSDVADVVDGALPQLQEIFSTDENLLEFDPVNAEDIKAAEQASDYVNYIFFKQNDGFNITRTWMFDALSQKNGYVKAWWDEAEKVSQESYKNLTTEQLFDLVDDKELEIIEISEHPEESPVPETPLLPAPPPQGVPQPGQPQVQPGPEIDPGPQIVTLHDVTFKRVTTEGRIRIENVPPEEFRISSDARKLDPSDARFVGHEREFKRHEIAAMGFDEDMVEDLPAGNKTGNENRRDKTDDTSGGSQDPSQDEIILREGFIRVDADRDGRAELIQVFTASDTQLSADVVDRQPFHALCPLPMPHKHFGQSLADKTMDIQDVTSTLTRQTLDNLYHSNNPGEAIWEQGMGDTTLDDLLSARIGRKVRTKRPPSETIMPLTVPFTAGSSFTMLEWYEKIKRERTGISNQSEALEPDALKNIQQSVMMTGLDQGKMKNQAVARVFAETGFKTLFLHIHELVLKHQDKSKIVRLRGGFVEVDPSDWRERFDMTVNIGLGLGTREQNLLHLGNIKELQKEIIEGGGAGDLVTRQNIYNTAEAFVKNAKLKDVSLFFQNPEGRPPPEPSKEELEVQKQTNALIERQQKQEAEKMALDREKVQLKHQTEMIKLQQNAQQMEKDFKLANEEMLNKLTEFELKYNRDVPGSKV